MYTWIFRSIPCLYFQCRSFCNSSRVREWPWHSRSASVWCWTTVPLFCVCKRLWPCTPLCFCIDGGVWPLGSYRYILSTFLYLLYYFNTILFFRSPHHIELKFILKTMSNTCWYDVFFLLNCTSPKFMLTVKIS